MQAPVVGGVAANGRVLSSQTPLVLSMSPIVESYSNRPSKFDSPECKLFPRYDAIVVSARQAYSHSDSVGKRYRQLVRMSPAACSCWVLNPQ
jgi:hypothetical protein